MATVLTAQRRGVAAAPGQPGALIFGEDPESEDTFAARHWASVYKELLALHQRLLLRLTGESDGLPEIARRGIEKSDQEMMRAHLEHLRGRLDFWERRSLALGGIDFDLAGRALRHRGHEVRLTRREAQLLDLFLHHPGREFSARAVAALAWQDRRLSAEQVRTYIVRLRAKLADAGVPCEVRTHARRGYALVFD